VDYHLSKEASEIMVRIRVDGRRAKSSLDGGAAGRASVVSPLHWGLNQTTGDLLIRLLANKIKITEERMKPEKAQLVIQGLKEAGVDFYRRCAGRPVYEVYKMLADDP